MKKPLLLALTAVFFLASLGGCGNFGKKKSLPGPNDKVYDVALAEAQSREIPDSTEFKGEFESGQSLELKSDFSGKVQALSIVEGQMVAPGDALLKIDDDKLPYLLDRQRAELKEAEVQLEIDTQAVGTPLTPEAGIDQEVDQSDNGAPLEQPNLPPENNNETGEEPPTEEGATPMPGGPQPQLSAKQMEDQMFESPAVRRANALRNRLARRQIGQQQPANPELVENRVALTQAKVDRIKAEIALTEKQLAGSTLAAPFDGFISKVGVAEGSMVQVNDFLLTLVTVDPIELELQIPKDQIDKVEKSMQFKVNIPDLHNESFPGEISFIGASVDPAKKTVEVRLRVPNSAFRIKIGMEGLAQVAVANHFHSAVLVPPTAVITRDGKKYVYVVKGQKAELQSVETGSVFDGLLEIKSGLRKNEKIVSQGISLLKDEEEFIRVRP